MSRRLRIEEEKARQLKDELQEEEDKLKLLQQKIFGPLVWRRFQNGIRVQDLQEKYFNDAVDLILNYFITEDVLFRNTKFAEDPLSYKSFAERLNFKLKDRASIMAIDEANENCIAGVLVLNPVQKCDFGRVYSRTMLVEGAPYKSIINFMNYVNRKVDVFDSFHCEIYLRYYLLCIKPEYRGHELKVINDLAERGVALIQEYNNCLTWNEEQKKYLLQVVEKHRKLFPKFNKNTPVTTLKSKK